MDNNHKYNISLKQEINIFDIYHIMMGIYLRELGIPHVFEIDDGGHDSAFYLPRLKDGFAYLLQDVEPVEE